MSIVSTVEIQNLPIWRRMQERGSLFTFDLEITARCNNNCRHCYINLPAGDQQTKSQEMSIDVIDAIASQAVKLGAVWCLITGGEPLLRSDFSDIYLMLKRKGLLVSVFTNATLINDKIIELFKKYPPRDIEITVYGATKETYEAITRLPGSYGLFIHGLEMLVSANIKVRLKAMALKGNILEMDKIAEFCQKYTKDFYRFDPVLHLRFDGNPTRNDEIRSERLSPEEIVNLEKSDENRFSGLLNNCDTYINANFSHHSCNHLFHCGTGNGTFVVSYNGKFRLCSSLWAPGTLYDLSTGTLQDAIQNFSPKIRDMRSNNQRFLETCRKCVLVNLCLWCPAHAYLETGELDGETPYFCQVAHARAEMIRNAQK
jgi:radical SAM protein with 4Fe4S-binding SPASM domain